MLRVILASLLDADMLLLSSLNYTPRLQLSQTASHFEQSACRCETIIIIIAEPVSCQHLSDFFASMGITTGLLICHSLRA